ncbi:cytochrome b/b6 domain-containing protein [Gemmobacter fulvus]|uniref:Cytochrome b/b6 domain-containing protein n=1 Tax=Gemmobacter fulvus TaxID=2840474 RepID=A0A975P6I6_9RHOB|nr:cytochrome b/b6 domain-containing protein [Gemmobacter fulvus]MBT9244886.1 cytochrome b/b6 domain-containing protein [Gemmobacter fulvus]QWK90759.1 cytochrome b/b6 domain-containing protein [Gemmobacter fulvus]
MPATNTSTAYGGIARSLHWLTALLILSAIGLGLYAESLPYDSSAALAQKAQIFSLHKTIGIAAFFVAAARILWALSQPRPAPLHPDRRLETLAAETVHWALYISMLAVPLSGWVHHAAVDGFAPILWPFGQNLPLVPKSEALAAGATTLHWLFGKLLIGSILLHVAGALKHALIDRDGTLARMTKGTPSGGRAHHPRGPIFAALALYAAGTATALSLTAAPTPSPAPQAVAETPAPTTPATGGNWQVVNGTLGFSVKQMGADVAGSFPDWQAEITFAESPTDGRHGRVRVTIDTTSLTLGAVTDQAKEAEFFDVAQHKQAVFEAEILPAAAGATGYVAQGSLTLRGVTVPLSLPFTLDLQGDSATMQGSATLDRRDFGMGASYSDESSVGFGVTVTVTLTATRKG